MAEDVQRWDLVVPTGDGETRHQVSVRAGGFSRLITWTVDGTVVVEKKSAEDTLVLTEPSYGALRLLFTSLGRSKRVTWFEPGSEASAHVGLGGIDLDPEPGSKAALLEERMRTHPRRYAARHVAAGVAKVVVPILIAFLVARFAVRIPWPDWDLPDLDLPSIPWPNLPDLVPDVDLPDWSLPGWLLWLLDKVKFVLPVLIGVALARNEMARRRKQDELKEELRARRTTGSPAGPREESAEEPGGTV